MYTTFNTNNLISDIINWFCLQVFLEQKKMLKTGLNIARFRQHIPIIEEETIEYFKRWGEQGQRGCPSYYFFIPIFHCMIHIGSFEMTTSVKYCSLFTSSLVKLHSIIKIRSFVYVITLWHKIIWLEMHFVIVWD